MTSRPALWRGGPPTLYWFLMGFDDSAQALFAADCARRVHEASVLWARFAQSRGLSFEVDERTVLPRITGRHDAVDVAIAALGSPRDGYRTRASAQVAAPLEGRVRVGLPGPIAALLGEIKPRTFFGEHGAPEMDDRLIVSSRPAELAQKIVSDRVVGVLQQLAGRRLDDFTYGGGAVAVVWAGVEHEIAVLDSVIDMLASVARLVQPGGAYR